MNSKHGLSIGPHRYVWHLGQWEQVDPDRPGVLLVDKGTEEERRDGTLMCQSMCREMRGPGSCPANGWLCEMDRMKWPPRKIRCVRYAASFVASFRALSGNRRWPLKALPIAPRSETGT